MLPARPNRFKIGDLTPRKSFIIIAMLLAVMTGAKGVVWAIVMPLAQQPDEPAHAAYADDLVRSWSLSARQRISSSSLDHVMDVSSANVMPFRDDQKGSFDDISLSERSRELAATQPAPKALGTQVSSASSYPPTYYALAGLASRAGASDDYVRSFFLMRTLGAVLAALAVVFQFAILRSVFGSIWKATCAAVFLSMMPMYSSLESAINPEVLLVLLASIALWSAVRIAQAPARPWLYVVAGLAIALAFLTKANGAAMLMPVLGAVIYSTRTRPLSERLRLIPALCLTVLPLMAAGVILRFLGSAAAASSATPTGSLSWAGIKAYVSFLQREGGYRYSDTYWGVFGWLDAPMPSWFWVAGFWFTVVTFIVCVVRFIDRGVPAWGWVLGPALIATVAVLFVVEYGTYSSTGAGMVQGRYFFSVATAIVAFQFWGLDRMFENRPRLGAVALVSATAAMCAMQMFAVLGVVIPRYYL